MEIWIANIWIAKTSEWCTLLVSYSNGLPGTMVLGIWIMDQYSNGGLNIGWLTKWWSEYRTAIVPGIWIVNHPRIEQIPMIWILNYFIIQIPTVLLDIIFPNIEDTNKTDLLFVSWGLGIVLDTWTLITASRVTRIKGLAYIDRVPYF